eukprot:s1332_g15.t1
MKVVCEFVESPRLLRAKRGGSRQLVLSGRPGVDCYGAELLDAVPKSEHHRYSFSYTSPGSFRGKVLKLTTAPVHFPCVLPRWPGWRFARERAFPSAQKACNLQHKAGLEDAGVDIEALRRRHIGCWKGALKKRHRGELPCEGLAAGDLRVRGRSRAHRRRRMRCCVRPQGGCDVGRASQCAPACMRQPLRLEWGARSRGGGSRKQLADLHATTLSKALGRQESPGSLYPGYYRGNWGGALQRPAYLRTCSRCHARSWGCGCNDDEALGRVLPMVRNWFGRWPVGCGATSGDDAKWSRSSPYFVKRLAVSCASHEKRRVCLVMGTYRDSNGYIGIVHNRKQETEVLEKSAEPTLVLEGCLQIASGAHRTLQDACGFRARAALQSWHRVRAAAAKSLASRSCALSSLMALHVRYFHDCRAGPGSRGARCNCAGSAGCRAGGPQTRQCRTCYSHSTYRWKLVSSAIASADGAVFWSWLEPGWTWVCEHGCAALSGARFAKGFLDSNWPARRAAIFSYGVVGLTRPLANILTQMWSPQISWDPSKCLRSSCRRAS